MGTRPQTGGFTPSHPSQAGGSVRPMYEEFTPITESQQGEQSQLLFVNIPGFAKEQIKVSVEGKNTLRVRGERLVGGNKWSRFQEDFRIPEECNISGVRAKFEGGILTITLPYKISALAQVGPAKQEAKTPSREPIPRPVDHLPPPKQEAKTPSREPIPRPVDQLPPLKQEAKTPNREPIPRPVDQLPPTKQEAKTPSREPIPRPVDQLPPKTISTVSEAKKTNGKWITEEPSSRKVATEPSKPQMGQGGSPPKPASSAASAKQPADGKGVGLMSAAKIIPDTTETEERSQGKWTSAPRIIPDTTETKERSQGKWSLTEIKTPERMAPEKAVQKEQETIEKGKESVKVENFTEKIVKKVKEEIEGTASVLKAKITDFSDVTKQKLITDDTTSGGGGSDDGFAHKYQQTMKELIAKGGNLNEERQLLLNMGTAILVIVALGAYISYTIGGGSSRNTEN